jgi:hypothetical protein
VTALYLARWLFVALLVGLTVHLVVRASRSDRR